MPLEYCPHSTTWGGGLIVSEILIFTLVAIVVYLAADRLLNFIEVRRGRRFEYRQIIYFFIVLALALALFEVMERYGP